jgi:hypothetical protein
MTNVSRMLGGAAVLLLVLSAVPAKAQMAEFGGMGGGDDMMTQMAPMMDMMKSQMGKRKFRKMMKGAGPMMGKMMENGGPDRMNGTAGGMPGSFGGGFPGGMGGFDQ